MAQCGVHNVGFFRVGVKLTAVPRICPQRTFGQSGIRTLLKADRKSRKEIRVGVGLWDMAIDGVVT